MTSHLVTVTFAAGQPRQLARFWGELLGREQADDVTLRPDGDTGFHIRFGATQEPKTSQNRAHFDLSSDSAEQQRQTVARALELGARHIDVGQRPEEEHVVLADPEGNEFCVVEGGNNFLAGCGFVGALSCDGSQQVGYFWSAALAWPLVWDRDEETAIQSPRGGPKISWGGPPLMPRVGLDRVRLELTTDDGDPNAEIDRLLSLGAKRAEAAHDEAGRATLTDPDGTEFTLLW